MKIYTVTPYFNIQADKYVHFATAIPNLQQVLIILLHNHVLLHHLKNNW